MVVSLCEKGHVCLARDVSRERSLNDGRCEQVFAHRRSALEELIWK
jgi:hypothetical protein